MTKEYTRHHYVPQWYQKKFMLPGQTEYCYLDLYPEEFRDSKGGKHFAKSVRKQGTSNCFVEDDLYTTIFNGVENKDIEKIFFGDIDRLGKDAIQYFEDFSHPMKDYKNYLDEILTYMSSQKLRTPKGLHWLQSEVRRTDQNSILKAMMNYTNMYNALWIEAVWQIADATQSDTKFIVSDHPITIYNRQCGPRHSLCRGANDPELYLQGSHTIFPLSLDKVLILTNLSWVQNPYGSALEKRPNTRQFGDAIFKFLDIQTLRNLTEEEVRQINFVIKSRAYNYIAAAKEEWLYPEKFVSKSNWHQFGQGYLFMPDPRPIHITTGLFMGFRDGRTESFDVFGRRPWQKDYNKESDQSDNFNTLYRFKGDFAHLFGPKRRGRISGPKGLEDEIDDESFHNHLLSYRKKKFKDKS